MVFEFAVLASPALIDVAFTCVQFHYFLYFIAPAAQPMMLITVNEDLEPCSKSVRVGERVDTVGQPGATHVF